MPHFTTSDELRIFYETYGFGQTGPPVVFLNGMSQTTRNWATHCRSLRDSHRIVAYDARGQGESDIPETAPKLDDHARDLAELLDEIDVDAAHLVGFSHGARVALGLASRRPDRVDRLVLCSATAQPTALARTIVRSWREVLEHGGLEAMAWASIPAIVGNEFLEKNEFLLDNIVRASVERNSREGIRLLLEGLDGFPGLADLAAGVDAPTLVLSADQDPLVSQKGAAELAELCGGDHRVVDSCGHTIPIERPELFQQLITEFLFETA